ncbi:hypothetical protein [Halanaerobacter jeridensis]|uniref:Uncharacterized protein n=1 Tax=Halanaerobacter jeridensis TaxID=706427 RepID=A0A939BM55_9FIRM|nr:hypothetical protein [Halanaerobacter jeridensis]MBM7555650.1 hypothetical protein [Halanaerobacter jeridensis]
MKHFKNYKKLIQILKKKVVKILLIAKTMYIPDTGKGCWKSLNNYNLIKRINFQIAYIGQNTT